MESPKDFEALAFVQLDHLLETYLNRFESITTVFHRQLHNALIRNEVHVIAGT